MTPVKDSRSNYKETGRECDGRERKIKDTRKKKQCDELEDTEERTKIREKGDEYKDTKQRGSVNEGEKRERKRK